MKKMKVALILHDVRSLHNVGSAFRTADSAGVERIYLTGYTPAPLDRFGREVKEIAKVALGAEQNIPWKKLSIEECLEELKKGSCEIIAIEQSKKSIDYKKIKPKKDFALLFGNEVDGLCEDILKKCDKVAEIPMSGKKESLNVSVSLGIALFRILDL